jgi:hypothetical protein
MARTTAAKKRHTGRAIAPAPQAFALGDWAKWTSQAKGSLREKVGVAVLRVLPHHWPYPADTMRDVRSAGRGGRDHESYVFEVQTGTGGAKKRYWPLVGKLERCKPVAGVGIRAVSAKQALKTMGL